MHQLEVAKRLAKFFDNLCISEINHKLTSIRLNLAKVPAEWEIPLLTVTKTSSREDFCNKFWKVDFEPQTVSQPQRNSNPTPKVSFAEIARRLYSLDGNLGFFNSYYSCVWKICNGKIGLMPRLEQKFITAAGCNSFEELAILFPKIRKSREKTTLPIRTGEKYNEITRKEIASKIIEFRKTGNQQSVIAKLSTMFSGKTPLRPEWEPALLYAFGISDRENLLTIVPNIRFYGQPRVDFPTKKEPAKPRKTRSRLYPGISIIQLVRKIDSSQNPSKENSLVVKLHRIFSGKRLLTNDFEIELLQALELPDRDALIAKFPKIRFQEKKTSTRDQLTAQLLEILTDEKWSFGTLHEFLTRRLRGQGFIPQEMETAFLLAANCADREAAKLHFPKILFSEEPQLTSPKPERPKKRATSAANSGYKRKSLAQISYDYMILHNKPGKPSSFYSIMCKILNGKIKITSENETAVLQATECADRPALRRKFPKVVFERQKKKPKTNSLAKIAEQLKKQYPEQAYTTRLQQLQKIFSGKKPLPIEWENQILEITDSANRRALRRKWPKIRFEETDQKQQIADLMKLLGMTNENSVNSSFVKILKGERFVPKNWEPHLLTVLACKTREEALTKYPLIRFYEN